METCVVPIQFSLVVCKNNLRDNFNCNLNENRNTKDDNGRVIIKSNTFISKGTCFMPFQGTIRFHPIKMNQMKNFDDPIVPCNWLSFVRFRPTLTPEVNLIGGMIGGDIVYTACKNIPPNTEIIAYYISQHTYTSIPPFINTSPFTSYKHHLQECPLDLSLVKSSAPSPYSSLCSFNSTSTNKSPSPPSTLDLSSSNQSSSSTKLAITNKTSVKVGLKEIRKGKLVKKNRERSMLPCEYCGKAFDRPSLLRRHLRTHTGEKPHVCDVCGKGFSTSSSLNTHRRIHSGEKPHECNVCGKRFTASSNLYYHRMTHNKEKPHKCTLCSKSFPTPGDLKSHMYVHNGSWPFKCDICNRGFSKQTNLRNHMYLHTGDRPYECDVCQKKFALACNLRAHIKTHEENNLDSNDKSKEKNTQ